jgi:hypothetical protein
MDGYLIGWDPVFFVVSSQLFQRLCDILLNVAVHVLCPVVPGYEPCAVVSKTNSFHVAAEVLIGLLKVDLGTRVLEAASDGH